MNKKIFYFLLAGICVGVSIQTYSEYSALKSIDSYESCIVSPGSRIQESYPSTCVTRLGARFTESIMGSRYSFYASEKYAYQFEYPHSTSSYDYSHRTYENYERHDFGVCGSIFAGDSSFDSTQVTENIPFEYLQDIRKLPIGKTIEYSARLANNLQVEYIAHRMNDAFIADQMWTSSKNASNEDSDVESQDATYYLFRDKNLYLINLSSKSRCTDYSRILSTFKFTE